MNPMPWVKFLVVAVACSGLLARHAHAQGAATLAEAVLDFPSFGVRVKVPPGWQRADSGVFGPDNSAVVLQLAAFAKGVPVAELLRLEIGAHVDSKDFPSLAKWAEHVAKLQSMRLTDEKVKLGSLTGMELVGEPSKDGSPKLTVCRVAEHAGYYYCLWHVSPSPMPVRTAFDRMAAAIVWTDPIAPVDALASSMAPVSLPCGITFSLPDPFRFFTEAKDKSLVFNTFDFRQDREEAGLVVASIDVGDVKIEVLRRRLNENAKRLGILGRDPKWSERAGQVPVSYTDRCECVQKEGEAPRIIQTVVARRTDGKCAVLTFTFPKVAAERYGKCVIEQVLPSFRESGERAK